MTDTGNTAVAKRPEHPIMVLRSRLEERQSEIKAALPGIPPERFIRAVVTAAQINPDILACSWQSVWLACMRACRDGLLPDGVEGALVPYKDKATWIPMYRGLLRKFQESGQYKWINASCVYEGDDFEHWIDEHGEHLRHKPSDTYDDAKIVRVYAIATTKDGGVFITVMPRKEIDKIRKHSRASREDAPWNTFFSEMAKKTALRRLSKMLPTAPLFEDEDEFIEDEATSPRLAAVNPDRERGAAAALDAFASSSPEWGDRPDSGAPDASGETGGGGNTAEIATPASNSGDTPAADAPENPIAVAHRLGVEAKAKGSPRKALPGEYRAPERDAEAQAWLAGWDGK